MVQTSSQTSTVVDGEASDVDVCPHRKRGFLLLLFDFVGNDEEHHPRGRIDNGASRDIEAMGAGGGYMRENPLAVPIIIVIVIVPHAPHHDHPSWWRRLRRMDWCGGDDMIAWWRRCWS